MDVEGEDDNEADEEETTIESDLQAETTIEQVKKYFKKENYPANVIECLNKAAHGMLVHQTTKKECHLPFTHLVSLQAKQKSVGLIQTGNLS